VDWVEGVAAAVGCVLFLINMWVNLGGVRLPSLECCLGRVSCRICLDSCGKVSWETQWSCFGSVTSLCSERMG
jgi:hypothetical protein